MSLTAFNRMRRLKQLEEMKPENIQKQEEKEEVVNEAEVAKPTMEEPKTEEVEKEKEEVLEPVKDEETKTSVRRGKRNSNSK